MTIVRCLQCDPAEIALAADMDALDAGGGRTQFRHHAQGSQCIDSRVRETEVALVEDRRHLPGRRGFHHANLQTQPVQCDGQAGAHQSAAHDEYVMCFRHAAMISPQRWALR